MAKIDDSAYVIIIAIALLVIMLVISNVYYPIYPGGAPLKTIAAFDVGTVGSVSEEPAISENIGTFVVGETQLLELESFPQLLIQRGYFGESKGSFDIEVRGEFLPNVRGVSLDFRVADTNQYGNLTIKWNGRTVFSGKPGMGSIEADVPPEAVKNENVLDLYAEGPGLFFWASTAYRLTGFDVTLEYGPDRIVPFQITSDELRVFANGAITFSTEGESDRLVVLVNGNPIFNGAPSTINAVEFNLITSPLFSGINAITFSAPENEVGLKNVKLEIFLNTESAVKTRTFEISQADANILQQGFAKPRLSYTVSEIKRPGALRVRINGQQIQGVLSQQGENLIDFDASLLRLGENVIEFSATGTFLVSDARIVLV